MSDKGSDKRISTRPEPLYTNFAHKPRLHEQIIRMVLFVFAAVSILSTVGIVVILGRESWLFFGYSRVMIGAFFGSTTWQPQLDQFGVWPLVLLLSMNAFAIIMRDRIRRRRLM